MTGGAALRRLPIDSQRPVLVFAWARLGLCLVTVTLVAALGLPYSGRLAALVAVVVLPWCIGCLVLARRSRELAMSPLVATGDVLILAAIEAVAPETYGAVRFMALSFLAVHAHLQGERIGLALAGLSVCVLVPTALIAGTDGVAHRVLALYEPMFAAAALTTVALVGGFRTAESASRLRARELTRRTMRSESEVRRRVSEALHDGPVQELIGLDMILAAARSAADDEGASRAAGLIEEARETASRNVVALRDEMIDLGPHAFEELSFEAACERCVPTWQRRYGLETRLDVKAGALPSEAEGDLFRITQEAVVNAAKHGSASLVEISLSVAADRLELRIRDDGGGFSASDPFAATEPGHFGLAGMRERAELLGGQLSFESTPEGTTVSVTAPVPEEEKAGAV